MRPRSRAWTRGSGSSPSRSITFDPNVDVWLADAGYEVSPPRTTIADLFGELGMFVGDSHWGEDERALSGTDGDGASSS